MTCAFRVPVVLASALCLSMAASPAAAQQSREEELARAQAEKATQLSPYKPARIERAVGRAMRFVAAPPSGFYPWMGSILSGGWAAAGIGYRQSFKSGSTIDGHGAISLKAYTLARATFVAPPMANRTVRAAFQAEAIDAKTVAFYGIGNDSLQESKVTYRYRPRTVGARVSFRPVRLVEVGGAASVLHIATDSERLADLELAPDRNLAPSFVVTRAFAAFDWRQAPGYTRSGGYYRVDWSIYDQYEKTGFGFSRVDADVRQFIPVLRENWVIALRALATMAYTEGDNRVPFFLMPDLGGGSDLRGYPSWRFRDRNKILVTAEYRWTPSHFVDMAIFHDAGKVSARKEDLNLRGLRHTNGIGIRFHTPGATVLRIELARGAEGVSFIFSFSPVG